MAQARCTSSALSPVAEFKQGAERAQSTHRSWSVLAAALVPLLLLTWRFDWLCDDAYITFVYARNLAEGHGLVYNPGEWVEGYSEFLWALVLAGGQVVGLADGLICWEVKKKISASGTLTKRWRSLKDNSRKLKGN